MKSVKSYLSFSVNSILSSTTPSDAQYYKRNKIENMAIQYNTLLALNKNTKVLLFLKMGTTPFTDDYTNFVPTGLHQGVYIIDNNNKLNTSLDDGIHSKLYRNVIKDVINNYDNIDIVQNKINELNNN